MEHIRRADLSRDVPSEHLVKSHSSHRALVSLPVGAFASVDLAPMKSEYMWEPQRQWLGLSTPEKKLSADTDWGLLQSTITQKAEESPREKQVSSG